VTKILFRIILNNTTFKVYEEIFFDVWKTEKGRLGPKKKAASSEKVSHARLPQ
jgi:hypothetical protein